MGVRISRIVLGSGPVVQVAGKLLREDLTELTSFCQSVSGPLILDLSNLLWADDDGVRALVEREQDGARLQGVSPLLALRLQTEKPA